MSNAPQGTVVATFLNENQQHRVDVALSGSAEVLAAKSWAELMRIIRTRPVTLAILNPKAGGHTNIDAIAEVLRTTPSLSIIMYVTLDAESFRAAIVLSRRGLDGIILQSIDDGPDRIRSIVADAGANPALRYVLRILQPAMDRLPMTLTHVIEDLFIAPHRYAAAHDLATKSGLSTLQLYREVQRATLPPPKKLIIAAKLLHACRYLHDANQSVALVARKVGYQNPRVLAQHSIQGFGRSPSALRTEGGSKRFHKKMISWLTPDGPA